MKIENVGYNYKHPNDIQLSRPDGSNDYVFILFKSPFSITLNGKAINSKSRAAIVYKKGTSQLYGGNQETNEQLVNDWFHFTINDEELKLWYQSDLSFDTLYELDDITFFSQTIKNMSYEFFSRGLYRESMIELYTKLLFTKLLEIVKYRTKDLNPLYDSFLNLRTTIQNHPMRNWQIDDISKSMSLSRSRVQHLYKYFFDSSIAADVINYRMERARYFLYHSTHSISKIAEISGYDNVSCFIRQFKKTFGTTPLKYRNQIHRATQYYVKKPEYECKHKQ